MNISAPSKLCFLISLVIAIIAIVGAKVATIPVVTPNVFWVAIVAWAVLAAGSLLKGF